MEEEKINVEEKKVTKSSSKNLTKSSTAKSTTSATKSKKVPETSKKVTTSPKKESTTSKTSTTKTKKNESTTPKKVITSPKKKSTTPKAKVEDKIVENVENEDKTEAVDLNINNNQENASTQPAEKKSTKTKTVKSTSSNKAKSKKVTSSPKASKTTKTKKNGSTPQKKKSVNKKTETPQVEEEPYDIIDVEGYHHLKLYSYVYDKIANPKGVVLIVHGMMEHAGRYDNFARFLNANGYYVIANDLRGHGHTAIDKKYGVGEKDIFSETVQDEIVMLEKIKDAYNLPVYLFGHSYGSMISQAIIQNTDIVEKCVLCGTANGSSGIMKTGGSFVKCLSLFKGDTAPGGLVEKMCITNYGKKFENGNWLSRDEEVFKAYQADEFCGGTFPFGFYRSMLTNMKKINSGINKIGNKKIFLIAGAKDPVGSNGKQVVALNKRYLNNNIDSRVKIYPDCRHELLNELNKEEVYNDILEFYNS